MGDFGVRQGRVRHLQPERPNRRQAFTLVEVLLVTVIVGILGVVAVQVVGGVSEESRLAAARETVRSIRNAIALHHARTGQWPAEIDPTWFEGGEIPPNPATEPARATRIYIDASNAPHKIEPTFRIVTPAQPRSGYWYNPTNGQFHGRVAENAFDEPEAAYAFING